MPIEPILPKGLKLELLLDRLRHLSWGAADILLAYAKGEAPPHGFSKVLEVQEGDQGPVSSADLAVNQWLLSGLRSNFSSIDWKLLSEETYKEVSKEGIPIDSEWLWILDPLDGTKDFLKGTGEYAVHLALVRDHSPSLGVVLLPDSEELWFGVLGIGSWCENRSGKKKYTSFSERRHLNDLILVASRNHRDERLEKLIASLSFGEVKAFGSVGCKVASILRGETDLYLSLSGKSAPKDWDMAAPEAVLVAAGGRFTHADGSPLKYNTGDVRQKGCLIASHGTNHGLLCEEVSREIEFIDPGFLV